MLLVHFALAPALQPYPLKQNLSYIKSFKCFLKVSGEFQSILFFCNLSSLPTVQISCRKLSAIHTMPPTPCSLVKPFLETDISHGTYFNLKGYRPFFFCTEASKVSFPGRGTGIAAAAAADRNPSAIRASSGCDKRDKRQAGPRQAKAGEGDWKRVKYATVATLRRLRRLRPALPTAPHSSTACRGPLPGCCRHRPPWCQAG